MIEIKMTKVEARTVVEREEKKQAAQREYNERWAQKNHSCSFYEYCQRKLKAKREERDAARQALGLPPVRRGAPRKWAPRVLAVGGAE